MAPDRLQPEWILEWLKRPSDILPGTRMPAFWPDYPKSSFPQLNGDAEAQIRAIRDHLLTFKGGPTPRRTWQRGCKRELNLRQVRCGRAWQVQVEGGKIPRPTWLT